jgi:hypothetical protein
VGIPAHHRMMIIRAFAAFLPISRKILSSIFSGFHSSSVPASRLSLDDHILLEQFFCSM